MNHMSRDITTVKEVDPVGCFFSCPNEKYISDGEQNLRTHPRNNPHDVTQCNLVVSGELCVSSCTILLYRTKDVFTSLRIR